MIARRFFSSNILASNKFALYPSRSNYLFSSQNQEALDKKTKQLFDELKNKDNLGGGTQRFAKEKTFGSYVIYEHPMNSKDINLRINFRLLTSSFWCGCGVLVFHFVNPYVSIIPLAIMARSLMSYNVGNKYIKSLIQKVELSQDKKTVKLYSISGKVYESLVEEMDFQGINDLQEAKSQDTQLKEDTNSDLSKLKKNSFLAVFDTTDLQKVYHRDLKILFNEQLVNMENAELLTKVLRGDSEAVQQFQYEVDGKENNSEELSDEKLEEQLQEEIRKRKK